MYGRGRTRRQIRFALHVSPEVKSVELAGDFNDWRPQRMKRCGDTCFVRHITCPDTEAGKSFQYKFIVDGVWITDPDNSHTATNTFGELNSVAVADVVASMQL